MPEVSPLRLHALRAMYLFLAVGLGIFVWPSILAPGAVEANMGTVVRSLVGAIGLLALLGLRYPLHMLPLLMFELVWKAIWLCAFALPMWLGPGLDAYAAETLFECAFGLILVPLVMPWRYVIRHYVTAAATPWSFAKTASRHPAA